jgi:Flp pilus assembly protein TadG
VVQMIFRNGSARKPLRADTSVIPNHQRPAEVRDQESGVYAVVLVLLTTLLLGVSALAVDLANARLVRTQAQNTVDSAVLAAAQDLPNEAKVVQTVKAYALDNFKLPASAWAGCVDADSLDVAIDTDTTNDCITTDSARSRLRVRLPITQMRTSFGRSIGVETVNIRATAEAEVLLSRDNRIIPAAVTSAAGTGLMCMESGGANTACGNSESGNFGSIESPRINIHFPSNAQNILRINYAIGIDHKLAIDPAGPPKICDGGQKTPCTLTNLDNGALEPNHLNFSTGNNIPTVTDGLVLGATIDTTDGEKVFCGRLQRPNLTADNIAQTDPGGCVPTPPTISVLGVPINGHHIAMWMVPAARNIFYPEIVALGTNPGLLSSAYQAGDLRLKCFIKGYKPGFPFPNCSSAGLSALSLAGLPIPFLMEDIVTDPRFGKIPAICAVVVKGGPKRPPCTFPSGGSGVGAIKGFYGAFQYMVFPNGGNTQVASVNGWIYDLSLIQSSVDLQFGFQSSPVVHLAK